MAKLLLIESTRLPICNYPAFSKTSSILASLSNLPRPVKLYMCQSIVLRQIAKQFTLSIF